MIDKDMLDTDKNKSICQYPFLHSHSTPTYDRLLCCIQSGEPIAKEASVEEYWNSDRMKKIRKDMLAGNKIPECEKCYVKEDAGVSSMRSTHYLNFLDNFITEEVVSTGHLDTLPSQFDYRTIHCNLTCVHCGPYYSSAHIPLAIKMGEDPEKIGHVFNVDYENTCTQEMIDSLDRRELSYIYWAGGEPMMSKQHWDVMEHMKKINEVDPDYVKSITVYYNTNLTRSTWKKIDAYEFLSFCNITFSPSLDGVGSTFEYIRQGGVWDKVEKNWISAYKNLYNGNPDDSNITLALAVTSLWIFDCDRYLSFFEPYNIKIMPQPLDRWIPENIVEEDSDDPLQLGFVDPNFFPENIMIPAFRKAISRIEKTTLAGKEDLLNVVESMQSQYYKHRHKYSNYYTYESKIKTLHLELQTKNSLSNVLREINIEAWLWYNSISKN